MDPRHTSLVLHLRFIIEAHTPFVLSYTFMPMAGNRPRTRLDTGSSLCQASIMHSTFVLHSLLPFLCLHSATEPSVTIDRLRYHHPHDCILGTATSHTRTEHHLKTPRLPDLQHRKSQLQQRDRGNLLLGQSQGVSVESNSKTKSDGNR